MPYPLKAEGNIKIQNVSFHYRDSDQVLDNINLQISAGTTIALWSFRRGKTTLCHLLPRFYDPTEGSILLDGIDIRDIKLSIERHMPGAAGHICSQGRLKTISDMANLTYH